MDYTAEAHRDPNDESFWHLSSRGAPVGVLFYDKATSMSGAFSTWTLRYGDGLKRAIPSPPDYPPINSAIAHVEAILSRDF